MNTILLVFALKLITVIDGRASGVSEPFYIRWRVTVRRENSCIQRVKYLVLVGERLPITVVLYPHRGSHDQPSSLIARAEPLAGFLGARRPFLADVFFGFKQGDHPRPRRSIEFLETLFTFQLEGGRLRCGEKARVRPPVGVTFV